MISQAQTNIGILSSAMPGARRFMIVTMMLMAARIDEMPSKCTAKIRERERVAGLQHERRIHRPAAGRRAARQEQREEQQAVVANGNSQNDQLFMRRQRHVGRADHHGDQPVREPRERGHDHARHHDQRVDRGHLS